MDTFPLLIFLGFVVFLGCVIGSVAYCVTHRERRGWLRAVAILAVGCVGLVPWLMVAPPLHMTLSSLSGTYRGEFGGGEHTFILHSNGTFDQTFVTDGGTRTTHGTWQIGNGGAGTIDFNHMLLTVDGFSNPQKPEVTSFSGASVQGIDDAIYFNEDDNICIKRISRKG